MKNAIGWCDDTRNPLGGCFKKSAGCKHCYAIPQAARLALMGQAKYAGLTTGLGSSANWTGLVNVDEAGLAALSDGPPGTRRFIDSMSDLFYDGVPAGAVERIFNILRAHPEIAYQALTKRPERIDAVLVAEGLLTVPYNLWLGTTVESSSELERIEMLEAVPAALRWLSVEPLLDDIAADPRFAAALARGKIAWVVVGGEAGSGARPCDIAWIERVVAVCQAHGVRVYVKQLGAKPMRGGRPVRLLAPVERKGATVMQKDRAGKHVPSWPASAQVREMPVLDDVIWAPMRAQWKPAKKRLPLVVEGGAS